MTQTTAYLLLEARLGEDLARYVAKKRDADWSWQTIRDELVAATGVRVSAASLRNWFHESETVGAA